MKYMLLVSLSLLIVGCSNSVEEPENAIPSETATETEEVISSTEEEKTEESTEEKDTNNEATSEVETETTEKTETTDILAAYSTEEIEYARIWLQFGPNPEVEELYVEKIPAGTPINDLDEGSLEYPEDVVQLRGVRLVDGIVTYSSNGDGTINLYNVPARWENPETYGNDSEVMEEETRKIIENTKTEYVNPGENTEVAEMADRLQN